MTFLQNPGAGTRSWLMGPKNISTEAAAWMEYNYGEDQSGRRAGEEYVEREWGDGVQENGGAREKAVRCRGRRQGSGGWLQISFVLNCDGKGYGPSFNDDHT
jgi:hypothetical protein